MTGEKYFKHPSSGGLGMRRSLDVHGEDFSVFLHVYKSGAVMVRDEARGQGWEEATEEEWSSGADAVRKRAAAERKAAQDLADARRYGIMVEQDDGYGVKTTKIIVRVTKTQYIAYGGARYCRRNGLSVKARGRHFRRPKICPARVDQFVGDRERIDIVKARRKEANA